MNRRSLLLLALLPLGVCATRSIQDRSREARGGVNVQAAAERAATADRVRPAPPAGNGAPPSWLASIDLAAHPETAPSVIHAVAEMPDRETAARTLARWLREESARDAADARGNVPNLIEALGETGGEIATAALVAALEDRSYDLALQTLIVRQLGEKAPRDALARFTARAQRAPTDNEFEIELRNEALAAARRDL